MAFVLAMFQKMNRLFKDLCSEFGLRTRMAGPVIGRYIYRNLIKEQRRLDAGWQYEPASFYEKNAAALALESRTNKIFTPQQRDQHRPLMAPVPMLKR